MRKIKKGEFYKIFPDEFFRVDMTELLIGRENDFSDYAEMSKEAVSAGFHLVEVADENNSHVEYAWEEV